jgi:hypothetical protein
MQKVLLHISRIYIFMEFISCQSLHTAAEITQFTTFYTLKNRQLAYIHTLNTESLHSFPNDQSGPTLNATRTRSTFHFKQHTV